jgi:hypothetical protein
MVLLSVEGAAWTEMYLNPPTRLPARKCAGKAHFPGYELSRYKLCGEIRGIVLNTLFSSKPHLNLYDAHWENDRSSSFKKLAQGCCVEDVDLLLVMISHTRLTHIKFIRITSLLDADLLDV